VLVNPRQDPICQKFSILNLHLNRIPRIKLIETEPLPQPSWGPES
jgi:hypothetical protein